MADAKNVAKKSSSIVERMSGVENTNRSPSSPAARLTLRFEPSARPEIPRIASTAPITKRNDAALHAYGQSLPLLQVILINSLASLLGGMAPVPKSKLGTIRGKKIRCACSSTQAEIFI